MSVRNEGDKTLSFFGGRQLWANKWKRKESCDLPPLPDRLVRCLLHLPPNYYKAPLLFSFASWRPLSLHAGKFGRVAIVAPPMPHATLVILVRLLCVWPWPSTVPPNILVFSAGATPNPRWLFRHVSVLTHQTLMPRCSFFFGCYNYCADVDPSESVLSPTPPATCWLGLSILVEESYFPYLLISLLFFSFVTFMVACI